MDTTSVFAPIYKSQEQDDGTLLIYGKATGSDLDLDNQRCDPEWLARAMPEWFKIGNLRAQHDPKQAVGKATEHEIKADGHYIRAHIVDPLAIAKTKAGVFTGLSIGIAKPRLEKTADEEWIRDGLISEISLCDRPCLPTATFTMCKSAKPGMEIMASDFDEERGLVKCEELTLDKAVDSDVEKPDDVPDVPAEPVTEKVSKPSPLSMPGARKVAGGEDKPAVEPVPEMTVKVGETMTPEQLKEYKAQFDGNADEVVDVPVEKTTEPDEPEFDRDAAKALVAAVAGKEGTDAAKAAGEFLAKADANVPPVYDDEQGDILNAQAAISIIGKLIVSEASELVDNPAEACDIQILLSAVSALRCFISREQQQSLGENDVDNDSLVLLAADADMDKTAKYNAGQLASMAKSGQAMKNPKGDPSYPIADKEDLSNAISAVGRGSGDHDAIRKHIQKRAAALNLSDMIPDSWSSSGASSGAKKSADPEETPMNVADVPIEKATDASNLVEKADAASLDEEQVLSIVNKSFGDLLAELFNSLAEIDDEDDDETSKSADADLTKGSLRSALVKGIAAAAKSTKNPLNKTFVSIVEASTESTEKSVSDLTERLEKVEQMATPGGPALRRTESERNNARSNDLANEAARFKRLAAVAEDPDLRRGYTAKAVELAAEVKALLA